jgi:uncharacterized membrane protein
MKLKIINGIVLVDLICVILVLAILLVPTMPLRIFLGIPLLLYFPGYTLISALFVGRNSIDPIGKVALSITISVAIVSLTGFVLNYLPIGITLEPVLFTICGFVFLFSLITLFRSRHSQTTEYDFSENTKSVSYWGNSILSRSFMIILIILVVAACGILGYVVFMPKSGEQFSEFYVLGNNGKAQNYPIEYIMDAGVITEVKYDDGTIDTSSKYGNVSLGIVNHEENKTAYFIKMQIDREPVDIIYEGSKYPTIGPIELTNGEKWERNIGILPVKESDNQMAEIMLYKDTENNLLNSLQIFINVK